MAPTTNQKNPSPNTSLLDTSNQDTLFTRTTADMLGITSLDTPGAELLEHISRESIKETVRLAAKWTGRCARRKMTVADVEFAIRTVQNCGQLNLSSTDTLNVGYHQLTQVPGSSNGIYSFQKMNGDIEVDKEDTETYGLIPRDLRVISYDLVKEGQPVQSEYTLNVEDDDGNYFEKNVPEPLMVKDEKPSSSGPSSCLEMFREAVKSTKIDQKVGLKPSAAEILTLEQQIFMKEIITVCMGQDDKKRLEALYTLETDAGIQVFLPHLIERVCKSISANISQRCLSLIIYGTRIIRSLSYNKACDMTVTLHLVIPALLSCCLGRNICAKPESDNHWALRDFAAKTLVAMIRDQVDKQDCGRTSRRLFDYAYKVFKNPNSTFCMIYGTIHLLQEFLPVSGRKTAWMLSEFAEITARCKVQMENTARLGHNSQVAMQEAARLSQIIGKSDTLIRSRYGIGSSGSSAQPIRRYN